MAIRIIAVYYYTAILDNAKMLATTVRSKQASFA